MEHFAKSWFWRFAAVGLIAALGSIGWALSGAGAPFPVAEAGGVHGHPRPGYIYTTSEAGDTLYVWPQLGEARTGYLERWSFADGSVTYKALTTYHPAAPGHPPIPGFVPVPPYGERQLPPAPEPGSGR